MSPIMKIVARRFKNNLFMNLVFITSFLFSMIVISLFIFFEVQINITHNAEYLELPFTDFLGTVITCVNITIIFLIIITFLTVNIYCRIKNENNSQTIAVLTSVGATKIQKIQIALYDVLFLYLPAIVVGTAAGIVPGVQSGNRFLGNPVIETDNTSLYLSAALWTAAAALALTVLSAFLSGVAFKRKSVIASVKKQNLKVSEQRHSYRQSKTFRDNTLIKRLAKKSTDYYSKTYNKIALTFACSASYPVLAGLLLYKLSKSDIVVDTNPYDGIDTAASVINASSDIFAFLAGCFLVLMCLGLLQAIFMSRIQIATRKKSTPVYISVGMTNIDVNKMMRYELKSVALRVIVILIFFTVIVNICYSMVSM